MLDRWPELVGVLLAIVLLVAAAMIWRIRGRFRDDLRTPSPSTPDGAHVLAYSRVWLAPFVLPLAASAYALVTWWSAPAELTGAVAMAAILWVTMLPLGIDVLRTRIVIDRAGLVRQTPWRASGRIGWDEITSVRWSPSMQWLVIASACETIYVSRYLLGVATLASLLRERVPAGRNDASAHALIEEIARG